MRFPVRYRAGCAQWLGRRTEKPGAFADGVRFPGAAWEFSPGGNFHCSLFGGVHTAPVCVSICEYVKNPKHCRPYHCLTVYTKTRHTFVGMGSAAPVAAVPP